MHDTNLIILKEWRRLRLCECRLRALCYHWPAEALALAERSAALYLDWDSIYWGMVPAHVQLDRLPEAEVALKKYRSLAPNMTISELRRLLPLRDPAALEMTLDGLQAAGLPE